MSRRKRKTSGTLTRKAWSAEDRRAFSDGNRLRALAVPARRFDGPTISEWR